MRVFPILAALAVTALMYLLIFERPAVMERLGMTAAATDAAPVEDPADAGSATSELVKVVVQHATAQEVDSAVIVRGQTAAVRQVDMRSEISAVVASEPLRKGARVSAGDALCVMDMGTRGGALDEARADLSEAQSRVPEAEARVTEAQASIEEASINRNAASQLSEGGFASRTRLAATEAAVAAAQAQLSAAQSGLEAAKAGIESARAGVAVAEKEIERLTIKAPFAGLLESDTAELGSLLQPGALCATILQLDPVKLVGFVPETEVNRVAVGAPATARLAAGDVRVQGAVAFLSRAADPATRTFRVEIDVPNPDLSIRDGQTAEIAIGSGGVKAHLLPQSALTLDDDGTLGVRAVDADATVVFHPVQVMRDTPTGVLLTGLPEEVDVIVRGQEYVTAGVTVAPTWSEVTQ